MTEQERTAICSALNILIWKIPYHPLWEPANWAAELQDKDILIDWDEEAEQFAPTKE